MQSWTEFLKSVKGMKLTSQQKSAMWKEVKKSKQPSSAPLMPSTTPASATRPKKPPKKSLWTVEHVQNTIQWLPTRYRLRRSRHASSASNSSSGSSRIPYLHFFAWGKQLGLSAGEIAKHWPKYQKTGRLL